MLLGRQSLGPVNRREDHVRLTTEQAEDSLVKIGDIETERMGEPLSEMHGVADAGQRRVGVAQQPLAPSSGIAGADARIVPPIEQRKRPMLLEIVEPASLIAMAPRGRRL